MSLVPEAAARARAWLSQDALPLWGSAGTDDSGAFHERLNFDGRPDLASTRRMRVQARQLYVFSEAALRGWWAPARAVADAGFEALLRDCWAPDGKPGFLHSLTADRSPLDLKRDTYDHAFGLFALAWYYKASGAPRALALAHEIVDLLEADLADRSAGGFVESRPPVLPRRSDPHMHLLEASLEWSEATAHPRFLELASRMVGLFKTRFFDPDTGTLREFFGADLGPADGPSGQVVAPGHHLEWTWLLAWAKTRGAGDAKPQADILYDYAIRYGLDDAGLAIDECDRQGRQVRRSRRAWPQTELIKAHITKAREGLPGAAEAAAQAAVDFLDSYLATEMRGLWMDQFDAQGRGMTDAAPASTLYHVVVAFRELILFAEASADIQTVGAR
jgi:mannose/cellobiose epimerase-like protein (N-acyl-D-glucosamine 2-epimerase family)